jgi:hypothetical protein
MMIDIAGTETQNTIDDIERSVSNMLDAAEETLTGYHLGSGVVAYVRRMQEADNALGEAAILAGQAGPEGYAERVARRRRSIDRAIARQITFVSHNAGKERHQTISTLYALFRLGHAPGVAPDGVLVGQLLTPTLFAPLDAFGRFVARFYLPWKGKRFNAADSTGRNVFTKSAPWVGRLFWPLYNDWKPYRPGYYTGFKFGTYTGSGVRDTEVSTLKLDYDNPSNPRLLVRSVLDELVQITDGYYLGKAMLRRPNGSYRLAAFFVLRKEG